MTSFRSWPRFRCPLTSLSTIELAMQSTSSLLIRGDSLFTATKSTCVFNAINLNSCPPLAVVKIYATMTGSVISSYANIILLLRLSCSTQIVQTIIQAITVFMIKRCRRLFTKYHFKNNTVCKVASAVDRNSSKISFSETSRYFSFMLSVPTTSILDVLWRSGTPIKHSNFGIVRKALTQILGGRQSDRFSLGHRKLLPAFGVKWPVSGETLTGRAICTSSSRVML